jgi:type IV secretory pathway ATPase VirB11/archaellum biosynthesis ATPase
MPDNDSAARPLSYVATRADADVLSALGHRDRPEGPFTMFDFVALGTAPLDLAAWLVSKVARGASLIAGSGPGGVGKTSTLRTLADFAPAHMPYVIASRETIDAAGDDPQCVICHEISSHSLDGYLWDQDLRDLLALQAKGHMVASTMHINTMEEGREQLLGVNEIPKDHFHAMNLFIFVRIEGEDMTVRRINNPEGQRFISEVAYSDGSAPHRTVYTHDDGLIDAPRDEDFEAECRRFLAAGPPSA